MEKLNMKNVLMLLLALFFVLLLSLSTLSKQPEYKAHFNLASDTRYYTYVNYKSSLMLGHRVLLTLADKRSDQEKIFNEETQCVYDDIWTEPPINMLEKIIIKELRSSNMFRSVDVDEKSPSLILEIELSSLVGHYNQQTRIAKGIVKIHPIFKSASDNRIIMNKIYEATSRSEVRRGNTYIPMITHIGNALHKVMEDMIRDLEQAIDSERRK
jgi:ABC-type uncharacterized transport system auxiliary subunit